MVSFRQRRCQSKGKTEKSLDSEWTLSEFSKRLALPRNPSWCICFRLCLLEHAGEYLPVMSVCVRESQILLYLSPTQSVAAPWEPSRTMSSPSLWREGRGEKRPSFSSISLVRRDNLPKLLFSTYIPPLLLSFELTDRRDETTSSWSWGWN